LSRFESGKRQPRVQDMVKIAEVLKVPVESLLHDGPAQAAPTPPPAADQRLEALSWMLEAAFERLGGAEAGFLSSLLLEAVSRLEFGMRGPQDQAAARKLAASAVDSIAPPEAVNPAGCR